MSSTLRWRPGEPTEGGHLPSALERTLSRRLWGTDGTCGGGEAVVDTSMIEYLRGLQDAGVEGAVELIDLIEDHGTIIVWHEH